MKKGRGQTTNNNNNNNNNSEWLYATVSPKNYEVFQTVCLKNDALIQIAVNMTYVIRIKY